MGWWSAPASLLTVCGWSPGVRSLVRGSVLPCGCLAGEYLTRRGGLITVIDGPASSCAVAAHRANQVIDERHPLPHSFHERGAAAS